MRASILIVALLGGTAYANTRIVVMTGSDDAAAMQVALAGRGADIAVVPAPEGALRLDRAAVAQREAVSAQAIAGVWIEQEPGTAEVCVVSSDGHVFRHAPLPVEDPSPRVFAAIATSLLDEVLAPPAGPNINVDVNVTVGGTSATTAAPAIYGAPGAMPAGAMPAIANPELPIRSDRTLLEFGPMLTPMSAGIEFGAMFPLGDHWRAGANAIVNVLFDTVTPSPVVGGNAELRHVGSGRRHFDVGIGAGLATVSNFDPVKLVTMRFGWVWEGPTHGLGVSISPVLVLTGDTSTPVVPAVYAALRWEVPI
jgi:hypothetical protein